MIDYASFGRDRVEEIVKMHLDTWSPTDLSVQLGEPFLRAFYELAVDDPDTLALGARRSGDDDLLCWCIGFRRYDAFNAGLRSTLGLSLHSLVLGRVLTGRLGISRVLGQFVGDRPERHVKCPEVHLGAFGRFGDGIEQVLILAKLIEHTARELCRDRPACWAVSDVANRGAKTIMLKAGFKQTATISEIGRTSVVYEFISV